MSYANEAAKIISTLLSEGYYFNYVHPGRPVGSIEVSFYDEEEDTNVVMTLSSKEYTVDYQWDDPRTRGDRLYNRIRALCKECYA